MFDRVLVVPVQADPVSLHQTLSVLESHGIRHEVSRSTAAALRNVRNHNPLLVMIHGGRADLALQDIVERLAGATDHRVPLLVLADELSEADEYRLLSSGARDALSTLDSPTRLRMRILTIRRDVLLDTEASQRYECGALSIHVGRREAFIDGDELSLTRSEFDLLATLARDPRRVVTHAELAACIGKHGSNNTMESHVSRLRKKVARSNGARAIESVRGVGYRLGKITASQKVS